MDRMNGVDGHGQARIGKFQVFSVQIRTNVN